VETFDAELCQRRSGNILIYHIGATSDGDELEGFIRNKEMNEDDDGDSWCLSAPTEKELLAQMMEIGFQKIDDNLYRYLGMDYSIGYCEADEADDIGLIWIAAPIDDLEE
jgi:hypothetical protein